MRSVIVIRLIVLITICCTLGCWTNRFYFGPPRPESEIAVLKSLRSVDTKVSVRIIKIDQRVLASSENCYFDRCEIAPGQHTLLLDEETVGLLPNRCKGKLEIDFYAEAGHQYEICPCCYDREWSAVVIDKTEDKIVSGSFHASECYDLECK